MKDKINIKALVIIIPIIILGAYLILFEDKLLTGLFIIAGSISLSFNEVMKWIQKLLKLFQIIGNNSKNKPSQNQEQPTNSPQAMATDQGTVHQHTHYHFHIGENAIQTRHEDEDLEPTLHEGVNQNG